MASTHMLKGRNTLKITDSFGDSATFNVSNTGIYLTIEHRRGFGDRTCSIAITEESAIALRDALLTDFPLIAKPSVSVSTVGELSSIEVTGGSVVINATGNVIVNNK